MPESGFLNFLNFFAIFFRNFLAGVQYLRNSGLKFFPFPGLSHPILAKNNAGKRFFKFFEFFLLFFSEFSCRGPVSAEFGPKIFFSLSRPISSSFGEKYCLKEVFSFFNFFAIFFGIFLPGSSMNGIWD